jgi:hypothetical protein
MSAIFRVLAGILIATPSFAQSLTELLQAKPAQGDGSFTTMTRPLMLKLKVNATSGGGVSSFYFADGKQVDKFPSGNKCAFTVPSSKISNGVFEGTLSQSKISVIGENDDNSAKTVGIKIANNETDEGKAIQLTCASLPAGGTLADLQKIIGPSLISLAPGEAQAQHETPPPPPAVSDDQKNDAARLLSAPSDVSFH